MSGRLQGKVAIITGSTSGIGRSTANLFAREGARVVVSGRRAELGEMVVREIKAAGGEAAYFRCDVGKSEELKALVQFAVDTYGRLDILMNNAFSGKRGSVLELEETEWDAHQAVAIKAVYLGCKFAIPEMIKAGGGSIVNTSSIHGILVAPHSAAYEAAKAAMINLTRQVAVDFGPQGIRVNSILPGWILTERADARREQDPGFVEFEERMRIVYPLRRTGKPIDIARAALFLASDESSWITGHALVVDGGQTLALQETIAMAAWEQAGLKGRL